MRKKEYILYFGIYRRAQTARLNNAASYAAVQTHPAHSARIFPQTPAMLNMDVSRHFHFLIVVRLGVERLCLVAVDAGFSGHAPKAKARTP
jgi:hypothetical protein